MTFAAYLPVLQGNYLFHDDYYLLLVGGSCRNHPQYGAYVHEYGRPLGIFIKCFYASLFNDPSHANMARAITLAAIALLGLLLYQAVKRELRSGSLGVLTASAIITLPPFQVSASMFAVSTSIYAGLCGLLAAEQALKIDSMTRLSRGDVLHIIGGVALFTVALLIYQPGAFLYMVPVALRLLYRSDPDYKALVRRAFTALLPAAIGACLYFVWFSSSGSNRGSVVRDPLGKLHWFVTDVLPNVFSFWSLTPRVAGGVVFAVSLLSVSVLNILWRSRRARISPDDAQPIGVLALKGVIVAGMTVAAFLPNLVADEDLSTYHILIALQPIVFVLGVCGLHQLSVLFSAPVDSTRLSTWTVSGILIRLVLVMAVGTGVATAHQNVNWLYVIPQTIELNYIREQLRAAIFTPVTTRSANGAVALSFEAVPHIHVVRPVGSLLTGMLRNRDEFGIMTSFFPQDVPWLVLAAMRELGFSSYTPSTKVTTGLDAVSFDSPEFMVHPAGRRMPVPEGSIVIDMNQIGVRWMIAEGG